jgi:hypothetical protein
MINRGTLRLGAGFLSSYLEIHHSLDKILLLMNHIAELCLIIKNSCAYR